MSADRFHPKHSALVVDRRPDGGLDFSVNSTATAAMSAEEVTELREWLSGPCHVDEAVDSLLASAGVAAEIEERSSHRDVCEDGSLCLQGCLRSEPCFRAIRSGQHETVTQTPPEDRGILAGVEAERDKWKQGFISERVAALEPKAPAPWEAECEVIEDYMPPFPEPDTRPKVVVRHKPSDRFLRHSLGPKQGHAWDCYGDHYQTVGLAREALSLSPHPTEKGWEQSGPLARPAPATCTSRPSTEWLTANVTHAHLRALLDHAESTILRGHESMADPEVYESACPFCGAASNASTKEPHDEGCVGEEARRWLAVEDARAIRRRGSS